MNNNECSDNYYTFKTFKKKFMIHNVMNEFSNYCCEILFIFIYKFD